MHYTIPPQGANTPDTRPWAGEPGTMVAVLGVECRGAAIKAKYLCSGITVALAGQGNQCLGDVDCIPSPVVAYVVIISTSRYVVMRIASFSTLLDAA